MKRRLGMVLLLVLGGVAVLLIARPGPVDDVLPDIDVPIFHQDPEEIVVTPETLNPPPPIGDTMVGGIFALGTQGGGLSEDATWEDPDVSGVFVRTTWSSIETDLGEFDFSNLDHELNQAITHSKYVSLSLGTGQDGTPDWLFTKGGVQGYDFQDGGSDLPAGKCGARMTLGDPTDQAYQDRYFAAIRAMAEHVKSNPAWYDAVAYVKISGANLFTHENRLPKRCEPGCVCNPQVWSEAGYTPAGLLDFYAKEMALLQEVYPGKPMVYALIQDGFPQLNNEGDYLTADGTSSGGELLTSVEQMESILQLGASTYGNLFVVAHYGLSDHHEPNRWVVRAGKNGQPTLFQTMNMQVLTEPADLQAALENMWTNTTAHYLEVYQEMLRRARDNDGRLVPNAAADTNTIKEWDALLKTRAPAF